jgi:hypothetical protein
MNFQANQASIQKTLFCPLSESTIDSNYLAAVDSGSCFVRNPGIETPGRDRILSSDIHIAKFV